jgi:hypothetical protein
LRTLTFPASLATNAVIEFGPSCFTSYVSSSFPSHIIEKSNDCRLRGMVSGVRGKEAFAIQANLDGKPPGSSGRFEPPLYICDALNGPFRAWSKAERYTIILGDGR